MTVAEAFACGLPVLSSRIGGMTEIVEDGVTGLHFEASLGKIDRLFIIFFAVFRHGVQLPILMAVKEENRV